LQQFARGGWLNVVVIDDGDIPDALDPCVHDQVRRVFAALGVGVVDVVVHGKLVPLLGHFQQMVCVQELAHEAGVPGRDLPEIVHELELRQLILARPDDLLHDLDEEMLNEVAELILLEQIKCYDWPKTYLEQWQEFRKKEMLV
jgi:hypothetical protein